MVTIKEWVAKGGKLPGEKGFDIEAVKEDVARTKRRRRRRKREAAVVTTPPQPIPEPGMRQIAAVEEGIKQTPAQVPLGATDVVTATDGTISFRAEDGLIHIIDPTGMEYIEPPGMARPITSDDMLMIVPGGIGKKVGQKALWTSANIVEANIGKLALKGGLAKAYQSNTKTARLIKNWLAKKLFTTTKTVTSTNPATGKVTSTIISSVGGTKPLVIAGVVIGSLAWVVEKSLGGKNFAGFLGKEEAAQAAGLAIWMAQGADDYDAYWAAREIQKDLLDPGKMNELSSYIPYKNVADGIVDYAEAALAAGEIMDQIMLDKQTAEEKGESGPEYWKRVNKQNDDREKALIDYYNEERKKQFDYEQAAYKASRKAQRAADKKFYREQARYWARQRDLEREKEVEDRQALAEFWLNYRKMVARMNDDNRPSNLKFGLL